MRKLFFKLQRIKTPYYKGLPVNFFKCTDTIIPVTVTVPNLPSIRCCLPTHFA